MCPDLVVAEQTLDRRKCIHCSSSAYDAHILSLSGSLAPHKHARGASVVGADTCHSSGAAWTEGGLDIRNPERQDTDTRVKLQFVTTRGQH